MTSLCLPAAERGLSVSVSPPCVGVGGQPSNNSEKGNVEGVGTKDPREEERHFVPSLQRPSELSHCPPVDASDTDHPRTLIT